MSKFVKIAIILGTAALFIAAKQTLPPSSPDTLMPPAARPSISPAEMMRTIDALPERFLNDYL